MTDETVSVICFFCYGKLLFCNVRNAPRGCALRRTRQMSQAIYVSLRPLLNKRHWRENVPRACLKNAFPQSASPSLRYILPSFGCRSPLRRPNSDKISHKLGLAAHENPFSDTL